MFIEKKKKKKKKLSEKPKGKTQATFLTLS